MSAVRDGAFWQFSVTDNGIGVPPEYAERIFVIFQRLHDRDACPGTGIGLALSRKIVKYHGGPPDVAGYRALSRCAVLFYPAGPAGERGRR